ncbi:methyl-accepting chemotaxis protein [Paenibacillus sp. V4I9]|uniref:methyl-accepting chemotaxis protein n=1 Tax=Paenibacillus sp. V4I9 TaxID=3042308 RepID=UPI0027804D19|nr:methyl-accepting chemotaxis protein [Paenibacillus sp. V4I9]MDQ0885109.1 methyl-accepting chemotaxis protein [Paenibacillus sp. V4I9]
MKTRINLNLAGKMIASYLAVSVLMIILGTYAFSSLRTLNSNQETIINQGLFPTSQLGEIGILAENTRVNMLSAVKNKDPKFADVAEKNLEEIKNKMDRYSILQLNPKETEILGEFKTNWTDFSSRVRDNIQLVKSNRYAEASEGLTKGGVSFSKASENIRQLLAVNNEKVSAIKNQSEKVYSQSTWFLLGVIALSTIMAVGIGLFSGRSLASPILKISDQVKRVAEGNLTLEPITVRNKDEVRTLAEGINHMTDNLKRLIRQVAETSISVAASSQQLLASAEQNSKATEQIASTAQELAGGAENQVHNINKSSEAVNEMSVRVQQIASNAVLVSSTAEQTSSHAEQGNQAIQTVIKQMQSIHLIMEQMSYVIKGLGDRSLEVDSITTAISDIASQTNLLSLNAAIEAARAGEHGRGFAVVAGEVQKLAEQSANSAKEISQVITFIQDGMKDAIQTMKKASQEVVQGIESVNVAGESFAKIQNSVDDVSSQVQKVSVASQRIAEGTKEVIFSITEVTKIAEIASYGTQNMAAATEEQLASMEEISSSSAALSKLAEELQTLIEQFRV